MLGFASLITLGIIFGFVFVVVFLAAYFIAYMLFGMARELLGDDKK